MMDERGINQDISSMNYLMGRIKALEDENARLRNFVHFLATNPRKPATWMQTREAAADLLAALKGDE
jgi:hypothetical protein